MSRIITVTLNPSIDKSTSTHQVAPEHKLRCEPARREPGGGGINASHAIMNLGGESTAVWSRGGETGQLMNRLLDELGIPHQPVDVSAMTRENLIVYEENSGQQFRFGMPGHPFTEDDADLWRQTIADVVCDPSYVILSGSLPPGVDPGFYGELIELLPDPCRVVLDTSGQPLRLALEKGVYMVKPNLRELGHIVGRELDSEEEIIKAAEQVVENGQAQVVLISLGRGGALYVTEYQHAALRAPIVRARSAVGAGDSMVGGAVYALNEGWPLPMALLYGVAAGTAAVITEGTELCRRADVDRLFDQMGGNGDLIASEPARMTA